MHGPQTDAGGLLVSGIPETGPGWPSLGMPKLLENSFRHRGRELINISFLTFLLASKGSAIHSGFLSIISA